MESDVFVRKENVCVTARKYLFKALAAHNMGTSFKEVSDLLNHYQDVTLLLFKLILNQDFNGHSKGPF